MVLSTAFRKLAALTSAACPLAPVLHSLLYSRFHQWLLRQLPPAREVIIHSAGIPAWCLAATQAEAL